MALAFDPKSDSPGLGFVIGPDREAAQQRAMNDCRSSAPGDRKQFCKIDTVKCEGDDTKKDD